MTFLCPPPSFWLKIGKRALKIEFNNITVLHMKHNGTDRAAVVDRVRFCRPPNAVQKSKSMKNKLINYFKKTA